MVACVRQSTDKRRACMILNTLSNKNKQYYNTQSMMTDYSYSVTHQTLSISGGVLFRLHII